MGIPPEPPPSSSTLRRSRRNNPRLPRRAAIGKRTFNATVRALEYLAEDGARVSLHAVDLDHATEIVAGDDHLTLPLEGLGMVPLLIEVAAGIEGGALDPLALIDRPSSGALALGGIWRSLRAPALPLIDVVMLVAASGDALATNALLAHVGLDRVNARIAKLRLGQTAVLDRFRDVRGPDDAPGVAVGGTREFARLFAALVNGEIVSPAVSAQVSEWLTGDQDLSLVASATGLDPFAHEHDPHGLLFLNKTGRDRGIRAEAGVLAGPRAGAAYSMVVCFDDLSIMHRLRVHDAFHTFGVELMEYAH